MKKLIAFAFTLVCVLALAGCNNADQEDTLSCSFRGEHEYFAISNGSIILSDTEDVFDGGDLEATRSDVFENVASYSTTFYTLVNGEKRIILSNSVIDQTGGSIKIDGDLGRVSGDGIIVGGKAESVDALEESLWFELKTTDLNGDENVYQIQLDLSK